VPENIQWLSASVEGVVVNRAVKAGNQVKAGDLIIVLSNPRLVQQMAESQWELEALDAEFQAAQAMQVSSLDDQASAVLNARLDYENNLLEYNARAELIKTGAVSRLDYERSRLMMDQGHQRWLSAEKQLSGLKKTLQSQSDAQAARLNKARKSLEIIQQQVDDLQIRATMDSIVLEMPLMSGQRVMMGDSIAKLAQQDSLIAELQIPEIQIRDVVVGQRVIVDTRNNKIEGLVSRIDPAVVNGNVLVDVSFSESLPDDARPDLSVEGDIRVTDIVDTMFVDRPVFTQSRGRSVFFKLSDDGNFVERVEAVVGYGSISQIQILEGLQVGDKVIVSDPSRFENHLKFYVR
jgi:HlyD family secretion protein